MSATSKTFQVTITATGSTYDISADNLVLVEASGTGSKVTYNIVDNAVPAVIVVDESPATISTASGYLISVTDVTTSTAFYLNPDRITDVLDNSSAAYIIYDRGYNEDFKFSVTQSRSTIRTAIAAIVSSGGGSVVTGITAFAGGGQGSATQLSYGYNEITTVATALDSVKLPAGVVGASVTILNDGANTANVYPATGGTINDGAANSPVTIAPGVTLVFTAITTTNWETSSQTLSATRVIAGAGAVAAPGLVVGANDNGQYEVSATQQGFSIGNALVGGYDTNGLFTGTISEQVVAAGVTVDGVLLKDGGVSANSMFAGFYPTAAQNTRADAGAVSVASYFTVVTTTGAAAITLAAGTQIGQMKKITMTVDGGDATLTLTGYTSIVFDNVGDYIILMWNGSAWFVLENNDAVVTP